MARQKYDPDTFPLIAEGMAREGATDAEICKALKVAKGTFYKYQNLYPEFKEAIERGKAPIDTKVENALLKRALGYEYDETSTEKETKDGKVVKTTSKTTKKQVLPDTTAIIFWLKNRKPKEWRDKQEIRHSGDDFLNTIIILPDNGRDRGKESK